NILILGHRPYSEIPYYLKAADVLVLPNSGKEEISKSWTSPMKMFEYMASQRPIVASDLISLREILNENNAVLVEPDNSRALAEGIMSALKKDDFSAKILIEAWQNVQKYTWTERVKNILLFIKPL
ncbi:MAG: glycosyltransferase, partial [Candidatus Portnoybacteria bacterium]|nr:glycosyltransferase [Candidatus Portnoybacteria bacterium]